MPSELPAGAEGRRSVRATCSTAGPRDKDDPTEQPRWGKVGKQRIEDAGRSIPKRMETVDDEILDHASKFIDKAKADGKPFFLWLNPTRMHIVTHLSEKYEKHAHARRTAGRSTKPAWRSSTTSSARSWRSSRTMGIEDNTIIVFTTDNGAENFTWPDGGQTPFAGGKGTVLEGGFRAPCILRWPGKVPAGKVENGIMSGLDWFPTFVAAAGNPNIVDELKAGQELGDETYKVHLDGYNQMDLITGKGPSKRNEIFYFAESDAGRRPHRRLQVPVHRPAQRLARRHRQARLADAGEPSARSVRAHGPSPDRSSPTDWYRLRVLALRLRPQEVGKFAQTFIDFPPMQEGATFNLEHLKNELEKKEASRQAQ